MSTRPDPAVTAASPEEVVRAIESMDLDAPWNEVAPQLRLVLPRRRPMPPGTDEMPVRMFPPGIAVGLGLDIGPAMLFVARKQLEGWGVTEDQAYERALDNVRERVGARRHFALVNERIADVPTIAFQSHEGWASSLLLLPDALCRVLGTREGIILAPMRDLVIQLPFGIERGFVRWLLDEFAAEDMNALDVPVLALDDGQLRPVREVRLPDPRAGPVH